MIVFFPDGPGGLPVLDQLNLGLIKNFTARSHVLSSVAPFCLLPLGKRSFQQAWEDGLSEVNASEC